ncbi:hypothetical protein EDD21DRAFT_372695 [Dissophora ornata]|nr:hypothetical protein EDD21DRAFT_372695 [Dissophora ornata]
MKSTTPHGTPSVVPQSVPDGQGPSISNASSPSTGTPTPTLLCFLYHSRANKTLRSVLVLVEQFYQYVRVREKLYMLVVQTTRAIEGPIGQGQDKINHTNSMSIPEAVAMKDIHITTLSQNVEATFSRCPLNVGFVKAMLRDLHVISGHIEHTKANGGAGALHRPENGGLDKTASDHAIFIKGLILSTGNNTLAQSKTELRMITRRYPMLWEMNRLVFATIHWLDLEPASTLNSAKASSRQKSLAMHPSRCRIDPVSALKTRIPSGVSSGAGRQPFATLQHHPSNVSLSNMSVGSRGSISSASGKPGMPSKVYTESPGESHFSQQAHQQLRQPSISQPFADVSSTMATTGSVPHNGSMDLGSPSMFGPQSIWGISLDESDDESTSEHQDGQEEDIEHIKSIWHNWNSGLQGQQLGLSIASKDSNNEDSAETVPDDDILDDEGDEEDDDRDSDEDMQDAPISTPRRDSKGDVARNRRPSLATLTPASQWLLKESQVIAKKTRSEWTLFPVLSEERQFTAAEGDDAKSRLALLGLGGHCAPLDLQPTEFQSHSQSEIEAQVRKRRFGIDPIRKVKKYKTTGSGRRCIRCLQISTNNSTNARPMQRRPQPHQIGSSPNVIPDIAAATLWYHNYDRSCICGGMWLEL